MFTGSRPWFLPCGLLLLAASCVEAEPIKGHAHGEFFPTARVHVDLGDATPTTPPPGFESATGTMAVELAATGARGDLSMTSGGLTTGDYDLLDTSATFDVVLAGEVWDLGLNAGLGFHRFHASFEGPAGEAEQRDDFVSLVIALEAAWLPVEPLRVYGRVQPELLFPAASVTLAEIGLQVRVVDKTHVFAAWRYYDFSRDGVEGPLTHTRLQVELDGLAVGVEMRF
ncbi:MAG: hypothetical protein U1F36_00365 [Planctomycetota bacterium]